jgi:hypothetical protein
MLPLAYIIPEIWDMLLVPCVVALSHNGIKFAVPPDKLPPPPPLRPSRELNTGSKSPYEYCSSRMVVWSNFAPLAGRIRRRVSLPDREELFVFNDTEAGRGSEIVLTGNLSTHV